ncbi:MAG: thermosome subunit [uncultured archaeon A07HR60]|nr:MAG: thermosome subunit [uncultured archaeon A07HR60]
MSQSEQQRQRAGSQPLFVLSEDSERTTGEDAQSANIQAGRAVAESVRTTLGPNGMDKMLVSDAGDVVVTNDGKTILEEMDIEHPAAEMLVEVAEGQAEDVGDGTTTAVALAGQLLDQTESLFDDDIHPTTITRGYREALEVAQKTIDELTLDTELDDTLLQQVAQTSMTSGGVGGLTPETLGNLVVEAVNAVHTDDGIDRESLTVEAQPGRVASASRLVDGIVGDFDTAGVHEPRAIEDVSVSILDTDLESPEADIDAEYQFDSTDQFTAAVQAEEQQLQSYADDIAAAGADAVFTTGNIAETTAGALLQHGITPFENIDSSTVTAIATATGASQVARVSELTEADLGSADTVSTESFDGEELTFVEGGDGDPAATLFIRGGTEHALNEVERAVNSGIDAVTAAIESEAVVPGGAAVEIAIAGAVREAASRYEGREQLAVEAFADAVEAIPRTLATNAGADPIDALVELRAANTDGIAGLLGSDAVVGDPVAQGIVDPASVKSEAIASAAETATMISRIDDVISAS